VMLLAAAIMAFPGEDSATPAEAAARFNQRLTYAAFTLVGGFGALAPVWAGLVPKTKAKRKPTKGRKHRTVQEVLEQTSGADSGA
jgi:hypothetical protein